MTTATNDLAVEHIIKRYGEATAVDDLSFSVRGGEIFGFVGSNGAGKSTTMRIILGVLASDGGTVTLGGKPIDFDLRRHIGYMPEERGLYPKMAIGKQLSYLAELHGKTSAQAHASAERWLERLGLADRINDPVGDLSLGNQQRVQLAAALVHDPVVLILDEPFSGLDPVAVDVMSDVLREKARDGAAVIFSSHQLDLVQRLCDRVGIIAHGTMRAIGTVPELRASGGTVLEVTAPDAPDRWADQLPGVSASRREGDTTYLSVTDQVDDQQVLSTAMSYGPVHRLAATTPDLTELFREVVSA